MRIDRPEPQRRIPQKHTAAIAVLVTAAIFAWLADFALYICDETNVLVDHETTWMLAFIATVVSLGAFAVGVAAYVERAVAEGLAADTTGPILQVIPSPLGGYQQVPDREMVLAAMGTYPVPEHRQPLRAVAGDPMPPERLGQAFRFGVEVRRAEERRRPHRQP